MLALPVFPAYATLADKAGWYALRALCIGVLLF
ncbi:MAG: ABC transporter permease, partial [Pseudomonadota bacterium]